MLQISQSGFDLLNSGQDSNESMALGVIAGLGSSTVSSGNATAVVSSQFNIPKNQAVGIVNSLIRQGYLTSASSNNPTGSGVPSVLPGRRPEPSIGVPSVLPAPSATSGGPTPRSVPTNVGSTPSVLPGQQPDPNLDVPSVLPPQQGLEETRVGGLVKGRQVGIKDRFRGMTLAKGLRA